MLTLQMVLAALVFGALVWRPRSWGSAVLAAAAAILGLGLGAVPMDALGLAVSQTLPLALFLTAAIWLAAYANRAGLAGRMAGLLADRARGRKLVLFSLVCSLCAFLTATVSLDGAVVLMVPLLFALARGAPDLFRPLLLATVVVANAFSLAVPQGNPTNLVVMERLGLAPGAFVAHLFAPALLATLVCVGTLAVAERRALRGRYDHINHPREPLSGAEKLAAGGLATAALAGAAFSWLGIAPWWALCGVSALVLVGAHLLRWPVPALEVPWRVVVQIAALVVVFGSLFGSLHVPTWTAASLGALIALGLVAGATASLANNLPASIVFTGVLGAGGLSPYAALAGLSVGALATPHGSVATLIAFDRSGEPVNGQSTWRYLRLWLPAAALATTAATAALWLGGGST